MLRNTLPATASAKITTQKLGKQILARVAHICCFGSTNHSPNIIGVEKYIKVKKTRDKTPWTQEELIGLHAALAVEKLYQETPDYFFKNNFDIDELYNLAYLYGVANCEGMAACAYIEARKMGLHSVQFIRFNPTKESKTNEELNCIIIECKGERILINPWDGMMCEWPNDNDIKKISALSAYHGHSMEIRKKVNHYPTELMPFKNTLFDDTRELTRQKNIELIKLKAATYRSKTFSNNISSS